MSTAVHVPAWKRIGLKLKSASTADQHTAPSVKEIGVQPRNATAKRSRDDSQDVHQSKRPKSAHDQHKQAHVDQAVPSANDRFISSVYKGRQSTTNTKTPTKIVFEEDGSKLADDNRSLSRKKSVSFTPETKAEDGRTGQDFAKAWLRGSNGDTNPQPEDKSTAPDTPSKTTTAPEATSLETAKKKKRAKGEARRQDQSTTAVARSACIAYLEQYANDRAQWKFNKSRQNDLLRHIWDPKSIPPALDSAIVEYIQGLQGAAAKQRLYEEAIAILDKLVDRHRESLPSDINMDTPEARKAAYEQAMQKQLGLMARYGLNEDEAAILEELKEEQQQAARADALLWQALHEFLYPGKPLRLEPILDMTAKSSNVAVVSGNRKSRKSRTAEIVISDSSSDDDSEDGSSDSDDSDASSESSD